MSKRPTMQDIADNLGISRSLVSRALADSYAISQKTKASVRAEASRIGYVVKEEKVVKTKNNNNLVVYIPRQSMSDQGHAMRILTGIESAANKYGLRITLCISETEFIPSKSNARGILIIAHMPEQTLKALKTTGLPIVMVDYIHTTAKIDNITADNYGGMYEAMRYLDEMGHRRFVFAGHYDYSHPFRLRYHAFCDYIRLSKANMQYREATTYSPPSLFDGDELLQILHSDFHPTAIVCMNDPTALLVYDLLNQHGFRIPEELSVMGFDNIAQSAWVDPQLTTVDISKTRMSEQAVALLVEKIDNESNKHKTICLETSIEERQSVKRLYAEHV